MDFEAKLDFIYKNLYQINNVQPNLHKFIGDEEQRTLTAELFIDNVLNNEDVCEKLMWKSEDRENLEQSEVRYFKLVYERLMMFRHEHHNGVLFAILEENLPKNL